MIPGRFEQCSLLSTLFPILEIDSRPVFLHSTTYLMPLFPSFMLFASSYLPLVPLILNQRSRGWAMRPQLSPDVSAQACVVGSVRKRAWKRLSSLFAGSPDAIEPGEVRRLDGELSGSHNKEHIVVVFKQASAATAWA